MSEADLDDYVGKQVVGKHATAAARAASGYTAARREGMMSYQDDTNGLYVDDGVTAIEAIVPAHGVWTSYTPVWTANGGTAPVLGNGFLDGHFQKIGRTVHFMIRLTGGTTTTWGSGASEWRFSLPVAAGAATWEQVFKDCGYVDVSASVIPVINATFGLGGYINTSSTFAQMIGFNAAVIPWTNGDKVLINATYQAGS